MIRTDIEQLIRPVIKDLGFELWGTEYLPQGQYSVLRIYIEKENGVSIDDCALVSKQINSILDVEEVLHGKYFLEVSSPGISRHLYNREHYQRYLGKNIEMKLNKPIKERKKLQGLLKAVDGNVIQLMVENELYEIPLSLVAKANLIGE